METTNCNDISSMGPDLVNDIWLLELIIMLVARSLSVDTPPSLVHTHKLTAKEQVPLSIDVADGQLSHSLGMGRNY